jgi:hypothetical protein
MKQPDATEVLGRTAEVLIAAAERSPDAWSQTVPTLASLADKMTKQNAAEVCGRAARAIASVASDSKQDASTREVLACSLIILAVRMNQPDAAKVLDHAMEVLITAKDQKSYKTWPETATLLASLAGKMTKEDAARLCRRAAGAIAGTGEIETNFDLATALAALTSRMDPTEANTVCKGAIRSILKKLGTPDISIIVLLSQIEPQTARRLAAELALSACAHNDIDAQNLDAILTDTERAVLVPLKLGMGGAMGQLARQVRMWEQGNSEKPPDLPLPCRLTTQALIELLKMPTCFGEARRVVLDHLENRYGSRFANYWDFIHYTSEQGLEFDFTAPPRQPDPDDSRKRMLEILDGSRAPGEAPERVHPNARQFRKPLNANSTARTELPGTVPF